MFSSCILPLILISTDNSCRKQLLLSNLASAIFVFPSFLFLLLVGILWKRKAFSSLWKVYLLLAWMHALPFYSLGYNLLLVYFVAQSVSNLASGSSFRLISMSFWHDPIIFDIVFTFWHHKMFWAHLTCSLSQAWTRPLLCGALGFLHSVLERDA